MINSVLENLWTCLQNDDILVFFANMHMAHWVRHGEPYWLLGQMVQVDIHESLRCRSQETMSAPTKRKGFWNRRQLYHLFTRRGAEFWSVYFPEPYGLVVTSREEFYRVSCVTVWGEGGHAIANLSRRIFPPSMRAVIDINKRGGLVL